MSGSGCTYFLILKSLPCVFPGDKVTKVVTLTILFRTCIEDYVLVILFLTYIEDYVLVILFRTYIEDYVHVSLFKLFLYI
jgi:hypothetical protein